MRKADAPLQSDEQRVNALPWWRHQYWWLALSLACPVGLLVFIARVQGVAIGFPGVWFMFVLVFPVLEELVFRGLIQGNLRRYPVMCETLLWRVSYANLATSTLFAAAHLLRGSETAAILWAASTFAPSLVFGWARDYYGSVPAAIALHIGYNGVFALAVWW